MAPQGGGLWTPFLWQSNIVLCGNSVAQCCIVCHGGFPGTWPGHLPGNRLCQGQRESGGSHKEDWGRWHAKKVTLRQCNGGAGTLTRTHGHGDTKRQRDTETCWHGGKVIPRQWRDWNPGQSNAPCALLTVLGWCSKFSKYKSFLSTKQMKFSFLFWVSLLLLNGLQGDVVWLPHPV